MKTSKVTSKNRNLRILVYGKQSVGKTHFALSGPGEVVVFDVEGRVSALAETPGIKPFSQVEYTERSIVRDFVDASTEVRSGSTPFRTFVLDSATDLEHLLERTEAFEGTKLGATLEDRKGVQKKFALADKRAFIEREILNATLTGPTRAHFVWTAHEKNRWDGQETTGKDPDGTRNLAHYFDLAFHMQLDQKTGNRTAVVTKSNYQSHFRVGQIVDDLSWTHLEPVINGTVETDDVSPQTILDAYEKAGKPNGTIHAWFAEVGFQQRDGKWVLSRTEKHRALGLLQTLAAEAATGVAA